MQFIPKLVAYSGECIYSADDDIISITAKYPRAENVYVVTIAEDTFFVKAESPATADEILGFVIKENSTTVILQSIVAAAMKNGNVKGRSELQHELKTVLGIC